MAATTFSTRTSTPAFYDSSSHCYDQEKANQDAYSDNWSNMNVTLDTATNNDESPQPLRPIAIFPCDCVKRLDDLRDNVDSAALTEDDILAILLIVRLGDALLQAGYSTFLARSFVDERSQNLLKHLGDEEGVLLLDMEIEVASVRWTFQHGAVMSYHRLSNNLDSDEMRLLSRIALAVLEDQETVPNALRQINDVEQKLYTGLQRFYHTYPGNLILLPLVASTGAILFFWRNSD